MSVATLTPNSLVNNAGGWSNVGGAGSIDAALADASDTTYAQAPNADPGTPAGIRVGFTTGAVPASAQIASIQALFRYKYTTTSTFSAATSLYDTVGHIDWNQIFNNTTPVQAASAPIYSARSDGTPWLQSDVDGIELNIWAYALLQLASLSLRVTYWQIPTVALTAPTNGGTVTTTTKPPIAWTYTDPEGTVQTHYQVKIFSAAQYSAGGFNPYTSTATVDTGDVAGAATSYTPTVDLVQGTTYRAYVRVKNSVNTGWSAWDNNTFTINVTPPPAPNLVVTPQLANASGPRNKLDITRTAGPPATTYMVIEYSDNGTTWATLRNGTIVNSPDGTTFTIYDYEIKPGVTRSYRAKAVLTV